MKQELWNRRFFATTRGCIVTLLCRRGRTVEELAHALGLTDNAVRAHLAVLERDGIVAQRGLRRGAGKPAYVYELAPGADAIFPHACLPALDLLLTLLAERLPSEELTALLRELGRRLAARWERPTGDVAARLNAAAAAFQDLGAIAELEPQPQAGEAWRLRAYRCPFSTLAASHPQICSLVEALLGELIGLPVRSVCTCEAAPRCCFEVCL
jgi:predicted ArsR family transcriptional regulator